MVKHKQDCQLIGCHTKWRAIVIVINAKYCIDCYQNTYRKPFKPFELVDNKRLSCYD